MLILRTMLSVAVLVAGIGIASADRKVDWSEYLEKPGERGPAIKHDEAAKVAPKTTAKAKPTRAKGAKNRIAAKAKHRKPASRRSARK